MEKVNALNTKAQIFKLGSVYLDGQASDVGVAYNGEALSFGNGVAGMEIQWVKDGSILVADRCVCTNISWEQLDQRGFVSGTAIRINDDPYLCRCLRVGDKEDIPNEWDALLDRYGEDNKLWNWDGMYFWGQEVLFRRTSHRATRGWMSAREWYGHDAVLQYAIIGFRPVLEPLISQPSEALLGSNTSVFGPHGESVKGCLVGFDDYDLTLAVDCGLSEKYDWAILSGQQVVASRSAIIGITKS